MIFTYFMCLLVICCNLEAKPVRDCPKYYLSHRIHRTDKRHKTFSIALDLLHRRQAKILVETGTSREGSTNCKGDGCSTLIWGDWAKSNGAHLYSVDINPDCIANARNACDLYADHITFVTSDSVAFLENFGEPIDFLYLDSFDFDFSDPLPSQEHHLKEIIAAYPYLHANSFVMIDDCDLPHGGKGKFVIDYLLERGWKIYASGYQVILGR